MPAITTISELPATPAVYALFGGRGRNRYVAYVGIANKLRNRVEQHLIRRDNSIATGTSTVHLNPDYVTQVAWWEYPKFIERHVLEAAEMIAFQVLNPALRSRGRHQSKAIALMEDGAFVMKMKELFQSPSNGTLIIPTLQDALERISALEERVAMLEQKIEE